MRLGLFGGTFDPVHFGHLLLAECAREQCQLDEVWLVPAAVSPHKQQRQLTPVAQRIEMLELAVGGQESLRVSRVEADRGGVSFTIDTLEYLAREAPDRQLFLIAGADTLEDLVNWREPRRVCELATLVVARRAGRPEPDFGCLSPVASPERIAEFRRHQVEMPEVALASRDLRYRVGAGKSVRFRTPRAVEEYIRAAGLYRDGEDPGSATAQRHGSCDVS
ncbi:MAG: nicotinate-nucleotide adenylyltransferase [Pirellulales bacterium]